jgi:hypothetical protein
MTFVIKGNLSLKDLEKTSGETRTAAASNWESNWYKVTEDLHHCATFILIDEIVDLLTDGLNFVRTNAPLSDTAEAEWTHIIEAVKACPLGNKGVAACQASQKYLLQQCERMVVLMDEVTR